MTKDETTVGHGMNALVVGGNGFIGSHLVDRLLQGGWDVTVLDPCDRRYDPMPPTVRFVRGGLDREDVVRDALTGAEVVFHLAWETIHEASGQNPVKDAVANLVPTIRLLDASGRAGIRRFVFASSGGTVYGPARQLPIPETHPQDPITPYGITKLAAEKYVQLFGRTHGLSYAILRPSTPYGPRQNPLARQGVIAVMLYRIARGLPITIWGEDTITRDYFYISDLVEALVLCAGLEFKEHRVFNFGGGEEVSLRQLIDMAEEVVGKKASVTFDAARGFDVPRLSLDTRRASREMGWTPKVSLSDGMLQTWRWMSQVFSLSTKDEMTKDEATWTSNA
jgi:UDP-glucose 4-epimerase